MSQHLITQYINRSSIFKVLNGAKLTSHKLKAYEASNRDNNISPEDIAESLHILQKIKVRDKTSKGTVPNSVIDISV